MIGGAADTQDLPNPDDVAAARLRLKDVARHTPVLTDELLDACVGADVFLKPECLQRTGSFKIRGAYNRLAQIPPGERKRGTVAFSSGNHAQGVAEAARLLGMPATIVMPHDAPEAKTAGVLRRGARLVGYDRLRESREAIASQIAEDTGAWLTPSFDHPHIIAGQGTAGWEFAQDLAARGVTLDVLICCVSGGGLIGGVALAFEALSPATRLYAAEPAGFDDHRRSLAAHALRSNKNAGGSACDALLAPQPGDLTFALTQDRLAGGLVITDAEAFAAMAFAWRRLKLVLEPGGAAALAAALCGRLDLRGARVGVVLTGGNVDAATFAAAISPRG